MSSFELRSYPWYLAPIVVAEHYTHLTLLSTILAHYRDRTVSQLRREPSIGEIIDLEYLEPRGMEDWELADQMMIEENALLDICLGRSDLSPEMAERLAAALGTTPQFWLQAQQRYKEFRKKEMSNDAVSV